MKYALLILISILAAGTAALADVPPDPGSERISVPLNIQVKSLPAGDLRYFLVSPMSVEEVRFEVDRTFTESADGKGGAARVAALWAVPAAAVKGDVTTRGSKASDDLKRDLFDNKIDGAIKLLSHNYQQTVRSSEKKDHIDALYVLKDDNGKPVIISMNNADNAASDVSSSGGPWWMAYAAAATLTALAIAVFGIWLVRRKGGSH